MFPDLAPGPLCQLAEAAEPAPSDVLELVPSATSAQIVELFQKLKSRPPLIQSPAQLARSIQPVSDSVSLTEEFKCKTADTEDNRHIVEK